MIDKQTGFIQLESNNVIKPFMALEDVKSLSIGESHIQRDMGNGWIWYDARNVKVEGLYFVVSFAFYNSELREVEMVFSSFKFDFTRGWESWNEQEERQKTVIFNNWLQAEIGSERNFGWGEVWAEYDAKGGSSSIGIRYKNYIILMNLALQKFCSCCCC